MAARNVYARSLMWLVSCSGLGYVLLLITRPSEEKLARIRATTSKRENYENERRHQLFTEQLQKAIGMNVVPLDETNGNQKKEEKKSTKEK